MNTYREEKLPQVVEDRLQEAYDIIRKEERKKMRKKNVIMMALTLTACVAGSFPVK